MSSSVSTLSVRPTAPEPSPERVRSLSLVNRPKPSPAADHAPEPTRPTAIYSRYVGGTYPSTVEQIRFDDGTLARTDLVRLHPNVAAYSVDYTGVAPTLPSRYRDEEWSRGGLAGEIEGDVVWILRHSYPTVGTAELSRTLRAAGYRIGPADLREHEAIAGTQAAIWKLTNGVTLDTQPLDVPIAASSDASLRGSAPGAVLDDGSGSWHARLDPRRETHLTFEFDGTPEIRDFTVDLGPATTAASVSWRLQRSGDGHAWRNVSSSQVEVVLGDSGERGETTRTKALGVGATLSTTGSAGPVGHRFYRLVLETADRAAAQVEIRVVRFTLAGAAGFRNNSRIVHLYRYLLEHARPVAGYEGRALVGARSDLGPAEFTTLARAVPVAQAARARSAPANTAGSASAGPSTSSTTRPVTTLRRATIGR